MPKAERRVWLPVIVLWFSWACGGPAYFDLHLDHPENQGAFRMDKVLRIEDAEINPTYRDQRVVCRESPFQVKYSNFTLWSRPPDDLVEDVVVDFWRKSRIFKNVGAYGDGGDADLSLRMKIEAIERYRDQDGWYARLAMDMEIVHADDGDAVLRHDFDRKLKLGRNKARDLPEKISQILHGELLKIAARLR